MAYKLHFCAFVVELCLERYSCTLFSPSRLDAKFYRMIDCWENCLGDSHYPHLVARTAAFCRCLSDIFLITRRFSSI